MSDVVDQEGASLDETESIDYAGLFGMMLAVFAGVNLVAGMAIPIIPWVISGGLVVPLLVLGSFAGKPYRMMILLMGVLCVIPPGIVLYLELFPKIRFG